MWIKPCCDNLWLWSLRHPLCCDVGFYAPFHGGACGGVGPVVRGCGDCDCFEPSVELLLSDHDVARPGDYGYPLPPSDASAESGQAHDPSTETAIAADVGGVAAADGSGGGMLDVFA